jgi:hypothetical protein
MMRRAAFAKATAGEGADRRSSKSGGRSDPSSDHEVRRRAQLSLMESARLNVT